VLIEIMKVEITSLWCWLGPLFSPISFTHNSIQKNPRIAALCYDFKTLNAETLIYTTLSPNSTATKPVQRKWRCLYSPRRSWRRE